MRWTREPHDLDRGAIQRAQSAAGAVLERERCDRIRARDGLAYDEPVPKCQPPHLRQEQPVNTHTRTEGTEEPVVGVPFCLECSATSQTYMEWPCAPELKRRITSMHITLKAYADGKKFEDPAWQSWQSVVTKLGEVLKK